MLNYIFYYIYFKIKTILFLIHNNKLRKSRIVNVDVRVSTFITVDLTKVCFNIVLLVFNELEFFYKTHNYFLANNDLYPIIIYLPDKFAYYFY